MLDAIGQEQATDITREQLESGWWDIGKPGTWGGSKDGKPATAELTVEDLRAMAEDYDPAIQEAPVTFDHIQQGPASGWVKAVRFANDTLQAKLSFVDGWAADMVCRKLFRARSMEYYKPFRVTGKAYLGAVTFLGAALPAVKGLAPQPVMFKSGEQPQIAIDAATMGLSETLNGEKEMSGQVDTDGVVAGIITKLKEFFTQEITLKDEEKNKVELTEQVNDLKAKLADSEAATAAALKERDEVKARLAAYDAEKAETGKKTALAEFGGKLDAAVTAGKLIPAEKGHWVKLAEAHPDQCAEYLGMIEARGVNVLFKELSAPASGDKPAPSGRSAPHRLLAEEKLKTEPENEDAKADLAACDLMDADEKLTFSEAVKRVRATQK